MNSVIPSAPVVALRRGSAAERAAGERHRRQLAAIAAAGDRPAFIALFNHFAPRIKAYVRRLGAAEADADELAQDTLLAVWRKAASYDPARSAVSSWIFTIARNLRIDALRRDQRRVLDLADPLLLPPPRPAVDVEVEVLERQTRVRLALLALPAEQAAVIHLAFYEGLSHGEIAASLAIPLGTVKSRMRLALQRFRRALEDTDGSAEAQDDPPQRAAA